MTATYSELEKLPTSVRSCSNLAQLKAQLMKLLDVALLNNLTQTNVGLDEPYEHGLEFYLMTESALPSPTWILQIEFHLSLPLFSSTITLLHSSTSFPHCSG